VRGAVRDRLIDDLDGPLDVVELEVIDLDDPGRTASGVIADLRSFEEHYATLAFGLGTVPRRRRPDDPLWQRPAGLLVAVSMVLAFLTLVSTAH
jgi:hypothetical protein